MPDILTRTERKMSVDNACYTCYPAAARNQQRKRLNANSDGLQEEAATEVQMRVQRL